ncbi:NUDIX hydrolase [Vallitalea okinawensis]|uniref:NUDIX hydrolase n=1 Tax=Vallitalea okinawensis TaxID=2078660 RepID=UPI000CFBFEB9|nr:NUDIX domain-containing protein [Vallitalea okinawensis]
MAKERFVMPVAVHLFLMKEDEVLLLRRYNTGYEDGNYSVVAGHVDGNEDFITAMIREAKEEAGITIERQNMIPVQVMHRKKDHEERIDYFLVANQWQGDIVNMEPNKCDELKWFNVKDLPKNIIPYIKWGLDNYQQGVQFSQFGWDL